MNGDGGSVGQSNELGNLTMGYPLGNIRVGTSVYVH